MPYNGLSRPIPTRLALALSSGPSAPSLLGLALSTMAQRLDPAQSAQAEMEAALAESQGLSGLLTLAKALPQRESWDGEDLDPTAPGLAGLLAQARLHRAAQQQGGE